MSPGKSPRSERRPAFLRRRHEGSARASPSAASSLPPLLPRGSQLDRPAATDLFGLHIRPRFGKFLGVLGVIADLAIVLWIFG
jgi:hypothetical protein